MRIMAARKGGPKVVSRFITLPCPYFGTPTRTACHSALLKYRRSLSPTLRPKAILRWLRACPPNNLLDKAETAARPLPVLQWPPAPRSETCCHDFRNEKFGVGTAGRRVGAGARPPARSVARQP